MHPGYAIEGVYLCRAPVDFRKAIDGLAAIVELEFGRNLFQTRSIFLFTDKRHKKIKALYWDRNGFCLWIKRLEKDRFCWPKTDGESLITLSVREFEWLLDGVNVWDINLHKTLALTSIYGGKSL